MNDEKIAICDQLRDLGFPSMANSLESDNPSTGEKQYYLADLDRARAETTEEEMPESVYFEVKDLLEQFFETPVEENHQRMTESIDLNRWNKLAGTLKD